MKYLLVFSFSCAMLASCYSYKVYPVEHRNFKYEGKKRTAYVVNTALKKEYRILQEAGLFNLTTDSLANDAVAIRLHPLGHGFVCGNPIIASAFTLGQLPVYFPDTYTYRFDEIENGESKPKEFKLQVAQRIWFWDMFAFRKKFAQKAGQTLAANYAGQGKADLSINR